MKERKRETKISRLRERKREIERERKGKIREKRSDTFYTTRTLFTKKKKKKQHTPIQGYKSQTVDEPYMERPDQF